MNRLPLAAALALALLALAAACKAAEEPPPTATPSPAPTATPTAMPVPTTVPPTTLGQGGFYVVDAATSGLWYLDWAGNYEWSPGGAVLAKGECCKANGGLDLFEASTARLTRIFVGDVLGVSWAPDASRLAFTSSAGRVYIIGRDGSGIVELKGLRGGTTIWSPNGNMLVTVANEYVYLTDVSTLTSAIVTKELGPSSFISSVQWSPAGRYLAVSGDYRDTGQGAWPVYVYDTSDASLTRLGNGSEAGFAWSPDGSEIAVADENGLTIYDPEGDPLRQLAAGVAAGATWSPDGSTIAFGFGEPLPFKGSEGRVTRQAFHLISADGSGVPVALPPGRSLGWSPDGQGIAFLSEGCITGEWDIFWASRDGVSLRRLTNTPEEVEEGLDWSGSGNQIAYSTSNTVMLLDAVSGRSQALAVDSSPEQWGVHLHGSSPVRSPWSGDGRYVAFFVGGGHGICD